MNKTLTTLLLILLSQIALAKDTLYFACLTDNHDKITVHRTADKLHYIYRFTKKGKVELEIKQPIALVRANSIKYHWSDSRDSYSLIFNNKNYYYHLTYQYVRGLSSDKTANPHLYWLQVQKMQPNNQLSEPILDMPCKDVQKDTDSLFYSTFDLQ